MLKASPTTATYELPTRRVSGAGWVFLVVSTLAGTNCAYCTISEDVTWFWIIDVVVVALIVMLTTRLSRRTTRVTIGSDGLVVHHPGGRSEYAAWRDVRSLKIAWQRTEGAAGAGGSRLELQRARARPLVVESGPAGAKAMRDLHEQARASHADVAAAAPDRAGALALGRGDREASAWLRELRAMRARPDDYRSAAVTDDLLWSVVEDPRVEPSARAGAAAALAVRADDEARARLRVVAEETASPRLRVALEGIAGAEGDTGLEEALGRVEAE